MSRSSRRLLLALLVPMAAVVPATALAASSATGPGEAAPPVGRVAQAKPWSLVGTADAGRSLVVRYGGFGGCETEPVATATEGDRAITVAVTSTVPTPERPIACPAIAHTPGNLTVRLTKSVAGRRIVGAKRLPATPFSTAPFPSGTENPARLVVPDVRGLRALDARRALCAAGFASRSAGRSPASTPVRSTDPRAGHRTARPTAAVLARRTSVGSCTGSAWKGARRVAVLTAPK